MLRFWLHQDFPQKINVLQIKGYLEYGQRWCNLILILLFLFVFILPVVLTPQSSIGAHKVLTTIIFVFFGCLFRFWQYLHQIFLLFIDTNKNLLKEFKSIQSQVCDTQIVFFEQGTKVLTCNFDVKSWGSRSYFYELFAIFKEKCLIRGNLTLIKNILKGFQTRFIKRNLPAILVKSLDKAKSAFYFFSVCIFVTHKTHLVI